MGDMNGGDDLTRNLETENAELLVLIQEIRDDLKFRSQFSEQPNVLDISSGILHKMDNALNKES